MPIYAYKCRSCEEAFEVKQKFSDDPITDCQICGTQDAVYRVIQPTGIIFKGSGWYVTDSRGNRENLTKKNTDNKSDSTTTNSESSGTPTTTQSPPSTAENVA